MKRITSYAVGLLGIGANLLPLVADAETQVTCLANSQTKQAFQIATSKSVPVLISQASNTWDDWTWRGSVFYCTATGGNVCTYSWGKTQTIGFDFSVGGGFGDLNNVAVLAGSVLSLFVIEGSYGYNKSWSETFSWSQQISGGYFAQPVMVVRRRWTSGVFQGTLYKTASTCTAGDGTGGDFNFDIGSPGYYYWWNPNARFGSWSGNLAVAKFGMYYVHQ